MDETHGRGIEVDVSPQEARHLTYPEPNLESEGVEGRSLGTFCAGYLQKPPRLIGVPAIRPDLRGVASGSRSRFAVDELGFVPNEDPLPHRGVERGLNHDVVKRQGRAGERARPVVLFDVYRLKLLEHVAAEGWLQVLVNDSAVALACPGAFCALDRCRVPGVEPFPECGF